MPLVEIVHQPFVRCQMPLRKQPQGRFPQLDASSRSRLTKKFGTRPLDFVPDVLDFGVDCFEPSDEHSGVVRDGLDGHRLVCLADCFPENPVQYRHLRN